ncbi:zinc-binding dehydrogenase [Microbispora bryophytorum]|uniref:Zinc-binding dehydrogenase n=1 Tax=Microbispora bryophytorum subsp. camponoti TaxID=1677852 RepID=A0ABR8LCH8_9ACTN|nr:zinc-binding dehydrogenase [Microbispora camponoti]MBD3146228.1 zinc-binding dehydrogenase [Microbispora camponoti]
MSRTVVFSAYGGPEVLRVAGLEPDEPGPGAIRVRVRAAAPDGVDAALARLTALYEKGDLKVRIQEAIPVEEVARAHRLIETGHTTGKLVLIF